MFINLYFALINLCSSGQFSKMVLFRIQTKLNHASKLANSYIQYCVGVIAHHSCRALWNIKVTKNDWHSPHCHCYCEHFVDFFTNTNTPHHQLSLIH